MDYTTEEINLIEFCVTNIDCGRGNCPLGESCDENKPLCEEIPPRMREGKELTPEQKTIMLFFFDDKQHSRLWKKDSCILKGTENECPNAQACDEEIPEGQKYICDELLDKLGLYSIEEYDILEREIEKVIINNISEIDWGVNEELHYFAHESITPVGRPDILLKGTESDSLYIIELKAGIATREHVGQLQSYVGWYKNNLPKPFKSVKGILVSRQLDDGARYAIEVSPDIMARVFKIHIDILNTD